MGIKPEEPKATFQAPLELDAPAFFFGLGLQLLDLGLPGLQLTLKSSVLFLEVIEEPSPHFCVFEGLYRFRRELEIGLSKFWQGCTREFMEIFPIFGAHLALSRIVLDEWRFCFQVESCLR